MKSKTFNRLLIFALSWFLFLPHRCVFAQATGIVSTPRGSIWKATTISGRFRRRALCPQSGYLRLYAKTASTVCIKTYLGAEVCFGAGGGGITSLNTLTAATQTFANGTSGTAPAFVSSSSTHTLNIPMASTANVTAGLLSKARYDLFNTRSKDINVLSPTTAETNLVQEKFPAAVTLTRISCSVDSGTSVVIQFDERAEATPNMAGTNVLTGNVTCDTTNGGITTSFTNARIAANAPLNLQIISSTANPNAVRIHVNIRLIEKRLLVALLCSRRSGRPITICALTVTAANKGAATGPAGRPRPRCRWRRTMLRPFRATTSFMSAMMEEPLPDVDSSLFRLSGPSDYLCRLSECSRGGHQRPCHAQRLGLVHDA